MAGERLPGHRNDADGPLVIDLDAPLVPAHSDEEQAAPTVKITFGFHQLCAFVDDGGDGTGEPLAAMLRAGNAASNTADHIAVTKAGLRQMPGHRTGRRVGRRVLVRTDGAGATNAFVGMAVRATAWLLGRICPAQPSRTCAGEGSGERVDPGLRSRRPGPRQRPRRRADRSP